MALKSDMPIKPFLSVILPVHDGAGWIDATLASVAAEWMDGIEVIVIDSSPTEATAKVVTRYVDRLALNLLRRRPMTPWQVKTNLGVELACSDHVCILHQDDLWLNGRVRSVQNWIAQAPEAVLHLAPSRLIDRLGRTVGRWTCPLSPNQELKTQSLIESLLVQNFVSMPAPVLRRSSWLQCGGMDESLWYTADWDIWLKLAKIGAVIYHDEITTAFRLHGNSLTVTGSRDRTQFRAQMEAVLRRHLRDIRPPNRREIERLARTSIDINVSLAGASAGSVTALASAVVDLLSLGPTGARRYLRDSRLGERVASRLRARLAGAF
jgi:glycosyltransferase involved in cell wall biosynthesis